MVWVRVSVSVKKKNNLGAGKLTDKYSRSTITRPGVLRNV